MHWPRGFSRKPHSDDVEDEMRFHLEMRATQYVSEGMNPREAQDRARREFGNLSSTMERTRAVNTCLWLESLLQDIRYAMRSLARNRGFTSVAVLALALGIGATTTVFTVVDRAMLRPLPYDQPDRLYWSGIRITGMFDEALPGAWYAGWREKQSAFERIAAFAGVADCALTAGGGLRQEEPSRLACSSVTESFLPLLRIQPVLGRNIRGEEDRPGGPKVALISYGLWQRRFGGDRELIGHPLVLDGEVRTVVGVMPQEFEFPTLAVVDVLIPLGLNEAQESMQRGTRLLHLLGRLKPGVSAERARVALDPLVASFREQIPQAEYRKRVTLALVSFQDQQVREMRTAFLVLMGAVVCVLLIACANVANLMLARTAARRQEIAVRLAIGAGRLRLIRQWLTESAVLGVVGGLGGVLLSVALLRLLVAVAPEGIPRLTQAAVDTRVLLFTLLVSLGTSALFGLAPLFQLRRHTIIGTPKAAGSGSSLPRHVLIVAQLSISLVLLTCAGLLMKSLWLLQSVQTGIRAENVYIVPFRAPREMTRQAPRQMAFFEEILSRIGGLPGITAVALSDAAPPAGRMGRNTLTVDGRPLPAEGDPTRTVTTRIVSPGYFQALGIRLVGGRLFNGRDTANSEPVLIINESLARRIFPGEDPLGKKIDGDTKRPWKTIVGLVSDVKNDGLREPAAPELMRPMSQAQSEFPPLVVVRSALEPAAVKTAVKAELHQLNPSHPVEIETMDERLNKQLRQPRFQTLLLALFAGVAVLLSVLGVYGVMSYLVVQRTREIGIRMALGASTGAVRRMVVKRALVLALAGVAMGLVGSWAATRSIGSLLFGTQPHDAAIFVAVALLLTGVCALAGYAPAQRAARIDPSTALHWD